MKNGFINTFFKIFIDWKLIKKIMLYSVTNVFLKYKSINYYFLNKKKKRRIEFL